MRPFIGYDRAKAFVEIKNDQKSQRNQTGAENIISVFYDLTHKAAQQTLQKKIYLYGLGAT